MIALAKAQTREEVWQPFGDWVATAVAPGLATQDAADAQRSTGERAMLLQGLQRIGGATGFEAAGIDGNSA